MSSYATLKEAYNIDTFNISKKTKKKPEIVNTETFMNDYSPQDDCYYKQNYGIDTGSCKKNYDSFTLQSSKTPANIETSKMALYSTEVQGYKSNEMNKQGESCSPLQQPQYENQLPSQCKKEFDKTMKVYTEDLTQKAPSYTEYNKNNTFNDIQPYYDEDMEQYFDINNLTDAVNYKSNSAYFPNSNENNYSDNNTNDYTNISNNNGDDLLKTNSFNLSDDDKKNALKALNTLKDIENKIRASQSNENIESVSKTNIETSKKEDDIKPSNNTSIFYNNLINIGLFIFIGIIVILLCDQIAELAIQLGMKKAMYIMQPLLEKTQQQIVPVSTSIPFAH